ncbi:MULTISPECIES: pro-sigmaK processing inhibitor BofA family protein [Methanobacterium]|jgi:inhibitor of the pro-sigma K processing machinery|uniref:Pro-sigmaK processing inhibitor BofA family protein n=1 Tax=Methanobacterium formicicum TaxID=2162 RepID=A0A090JVB7_METFO|nr:MULTISPECIES: pro-sigmaK processing inhibitor BofA family protein [Methanobacterium]KUK72246.1 MAG: SigmaK-factor processing regulatory BofA [Methanobacterium sp. 42_16]MBF4474842.1 pro-sigmaK processing inhibitor BofA family protein [Methanobacterium formicicum]MDD4810748.1 pro-sigmaK processing inhibitor BofA family protein [Methanobacterium formicicum]MDG3548570.1 pro-sigmaK processing inhibitor BofA family protein [Methanobacterium formicicum]MDH2660272.1 pro-sigmaK processing inhibitor
MEFVTMVIIGIVLLVVGIFGVTILLKLGKIALSVLVHMVLGWILLFIWNILPFFKIPINILTMLVAGFGGIIGVGVLVLAKALGLY